MEDPSRPAGATGTIGVEAFDAPYGAGFEVDDDSPHALDCELVEDGGAFVAHRPEAAARPRRVAFVDGTMRTEARLTHTGPEGDLTLGLAGSWAAGAVLVTDEGPARFDRIAVGRTAIFTGGRAIRLPDHRDGWGWEPHAVEGSDIEVARQHLRRLMRGAESAIAERLCGDNWLTVLDGPLYGIRRRRSLPFIGYVKTHHRRLLAPDLWLRVPGLSVPATRTGSSSASRSTSHRSRNAVGVICLLRPGLRARLSSYGRWVENRRLLDAGACFRCSAPEGVPVLPNGGTNELLP